MYGVYCNDLRALVNEYIVYKCSRVSWSYHDYCNYAARNSLSVHVAYKYLAMHTFYQ